ncbi:hypothetical protein [Flavobacterium micromati]|nr:hypothetical protein [Flavobacterium micromati]
MKIKDLNTISAAERIVLTEQLWNSLPKKEIEILSYLKSELILGYKK